MQLFAAGACRRRPLVVTVLATLVVLASLLYGDCNAADAVQEFTDEVVFEERPAVPWDDSVVAPGSDLLQDLPDAQQGSHATDEDEELLRNLSLEAQEAQRYIQAHKGQAALLAAEPVEDQSQVTASDPLAASEPVEQSQETGGDPLAVDASSSNNTQAADTVPEFTMPGPAAQGIPPPDTGDGIPTSADPLAAQPATDQTPSIPSDPLSQGTSPTFKAEVREWDTDTDKESVKWQDNSETTLARVQAQGKTRAATQPPAPVPDSSMPAETAAPPPPAAAGNPEEQTMPLALSAPPTAAPQQPSAASAAPADTPAQEHTPGAVPVYNQGDRAAQEKMLKTVQDEMQRSAPGLGSHVTTSEPRDPMDVSGNWGFDASDAAHAKSAAKSADPSQGCTTTDGCQAQAEKHVRAAGKAVAEAKKAAEAGDSTQEKYWKQQMDDEHEAAVSMTTHARSLTTRDGAKKAWNKIQHELSVAQGKESAEKQSEAQASEAQARAFDKQVASESTSKARQKLGTMRTEATDANAAADAKVNDVEALKAKAIKAANVAATSATVEDKVAAEKARSAANVAMGLAHEAKTKAAQKQSAAGDLGTTLEAKKLKKQKDAACEAGEKMAKELCAISYKSAKDVCGNPGNDDAELAKGCLDKADQDRLACHAIAAKKHNDCDVLAQQQIYGDSISGYEIRVSAAMGIEGYDQQVDFDLRKAIAARCNVAAKDVVTLNVKSGEQLQITLAVAGSQTALQDRIAALASTLSSGEPVGGVQALDVATRYRRTLVLPGQAPKKWVSEKAQKAWQVSQDETRKLVGMPDESSVREVNQKAHSHELQSKRELAVSKTKEANLKTTSTEMSTKVASKQALKDQQAEVEEAMNHAGADEQGIAGDAANSGSAAVTSNMGNSGGMSESGSSAQTFDADQVSSALVVIRNRFWAQEGEWLKTHNPALHEMLRKAKAVGNDAGDEQWKRFMLNWGYARNREQSGYRYSWNADGTYTVQRHLVVSCRKYLTQTQLHDDTWESGPTSAAGECEGSQARNVYSVSIRSVNNLCYPGVSEASAARDLPSGSGAVAFINTRKKACFKSQTPVSVRLSRFRLVKPPRKHASGLMHGMNGAPAMYLLRAYRAVTPSKFARKIGSYVGEENDGLVGVHRVKWTVNMVAEYCDKESEDGDGTARPYDETVSWPRKMHEAGMMKWLPIAVTNQQKPNSDMMLTVMRLITQDKRLSITCRTPQVAGVVNGKYLTPVDTKCDIKVTNWPYALTCPPGKIRGLSLVTSMLTRYDDASNPEDTNVDENEIHVNSKKTTMKFQKTASMRVLQPDASWQNRGSVYMRMQISEPHWTPSTQFQSHRHYTFSFGLNRDAMDSIGNTELLWDPQLTSNFETKSDETKLDPKHTVTTLHQQPRITFSSFLGLSEGLQRTSAASPQVVAWGISVLLLVAVTLYMNNCA